MRTFRLVAAIAVVVSLAACGSDEDATMPGVTGEQLDVAKSDIRNAGYEDDVEVVGGGLFGVVVESNWEVCEQSPAAGEAVTNEPRLIVERSCDDDASERSATASPDVDESEPSSEPHVYQGPRYEIVIVDEDQGPARLSRYWVLTNKFNYATDGYKAQIKALITDVARKAETANLIVEVVTDKEIAEAEAESTFEDFVAEHGSDYAINVIPKKEKVAWVASYTGGFDAEAGEAGESADAYELIWRPYATSEIEKWKPDIGSD